MKTAATSMKPVSRREFLTTSAAATAALCATGPLWCREASAAVTNRSELSLNGPWQVAKAGTEEWLPAAVPGCIHTDLLAAGKIADPFYRDNEKTVQWVGETDWLYRRTFQVEPELLEHKQVLLRCEGLDTLATIRLNGQQVGTTDNMFRTWEFEVKPLLKPGKNVLEVLLASAVPFVKTREDRRKENKGVTGRAWLRKQPCHFGWDWAPTLITSGIWKSISLQAVDQARLEDVLVLQDHSVKGEVGLTVKLGARALSAGPLKAQIQVRHNGQVVGQSLVALSEDRSSGPKSVGLSDSKGPPLPQPLSSKERRGEQAPESAQDAKASPSPPQEERAGERRPMSPVTSTQPLSSKERRGGQAPESTQDAKASPSPPREERAGERRPLPTATPTNWQCGRGQLLLKAPKLWWPAGMGEQPLYEVCVELLNDQGRLLDSATKRIGLRTLGILEQEKDKPLRFAVNGVEFFAKGANWIPADAFSTRVSPERLRQYVAEAVAVNMNMLRFWGGGYYEEDALYDACDELGICVWVDFKFACASYPAFDAQFVENVRHEARDNLKRLRHHPCIGVWCGNNEISLLVKDDWSEFSMGRDGYNYLFKEVLGQEVKTHAPQASYVSGSPDCGDVHYWEVWWGARTFEAYRELRGFMSEFGYQSYPEPRTVYAYTSEADRASTMTDVMKWHQRCPLGNDRIKNMTGNYFRPGKDFDSTLWISQLVQAYGIRLGAEYWRQHMPQSMGCLFWQYNDCWPVASWASVDYHGRWKALHYAARHFYAPLLVSGLEDEKNHAVDLFVTSDLLKQEHGTVAWRVTDLKGTLLNDGTLATAFPAQKSQVITRLDLLKLSQEHGQNKLLIWLKLLVDGREVSRNLVTFARPKDIDLLEPRLKTTVAEEKSGFRVTLTAEKPALWAWLSLKQADATYSDNFIHLDAHTAVEILVQPKAPLSKAEFTRQLRARSLFDTYC